MADDYGSAPPESGGPDLWQLLRGNQQPATGMDPNYGVPNALVQQARTNALGNVGSLLLSAAQRQTPDQRAATYSKIGEAANVQPQLMNAAQMQLFNIKMQDAQRQMLLNNFRLRAMNDPSVFSALKETFPNLTPAMVAMATPDQLTTWMQKSKVMQTPAEIAQQDATTRKVQAEAEAAEHPTVTVGPGQTVIDKKTGQPVYQNASGDLTPDAVDFYARQVALKGDYSGLTGLYRRPDMLAQIKNRAVQIAKENNLNPEDVSSNFAQFQSEKAAQRTMGTRVGNLLPASLILEGTIPLALNAYDKMKDVMTQYPDVNKVLQMGMTRTGDPRVVALGQYLTTIVNAYARATGSSGGTVSDKEHAREYLQTYWSEGQLGAVLKAMQQEIDMEKEKLGAGAQRDVRQIYGLQPGASAAPAAAVPAPAGVRKYNPLTGQIE